MHLLLERLIPCLQTVNLKSGKDVSNEPWKYSKYSQGQSKKVTDRKESYKTGKLALPKTDCSHKGLVCTKVRERWGEREMDGGA